MSQLYTCGRVHKPHKNQRLCSSSAKAKTVVDAVLKIMQEELGKGACERWCSRLNAELGDRSFGLGGEERNSKAAAVPRVWVPAKPKLALALLDEFSRALEAPLESSPRKSVGANGVVTKILGRHVVERLRQSKGAEWLKQCGEMPDDQLNDPARLNLTLSRAAFDLLVYIHARAEELQREDGVEAVIELQSADQTVVGRAMRGSGVVYCEAGRSILARTLALVREAMESM